MAVELLLIILVVFEVIKYMYVDDKCQTLFSSTFLYLLFEAILYVHCVCVVVNGEVAVQDDKLAYCAGEFIVWYSVKVNRIYLL